MVLQKRLDYGFNGYQVPAIPRGSRSARSKGSTRKKNVDNQMCAFELLATVAGKLLQEKDISSIPCDVEPEITQENVRESKEKDVCYRKNGEQALPSLGHSLTSTKGTINQEAVVHEKLFKIEHCDQVSSDESVFASGAGSQRHMSRQAVNYTSKEYLHPQDDRNSRAFSRITKSDSSEHVACAQESIFDKGTNMFTNYSVDSLFRGHDILSTMPENTHMKCGDRKGSPEDLVDRKLVTQQERISDDVNGIIPDSCTSQESMKLDTKPNALVSSDSSIDIPLCDEYITCSFPDCRDDATKVVSRDDDENSSGCTQPRAISVKAFRSSCLGNWKVRKMLASEFWKVAPKLESDGENCNTDMDVKTLFRSGKACYTRQRTQRSSPSKRRKLFEQNSIATSDKGIICEDISSSPEKVVDGEASGSGATMHKTNDLSSPVANTKSPFKSGDSHVKLSIKSFKVPELCIEMPKTATVATLKMAVLDAVTSILGDGVKVGVLLHGKKVHGDEKTLIQTGISEVDKLDSVGFMLEPNSPFVSSPCVFSSPETQPITRYPTLTHSEPMVVNAIPGPIVTGSSGWSDSDHDSVLSPNADLPPEKISSDSRALVALPTMSMEALAVIPFHRKSRRAELVQRRMRRPFSVSEVEALVQAVEKLGTGRWRDVKLRAFDNAKHRTYVDLKDKWKTLVHTARIAPQQRRGEPVPQALLNRVLAAHAYWSQLQAKQQAKQQEEPCFLL